jgi:hypothetical protein
MQMGGLGGVPRWLAAAALRRRWHGSHAVVLRIAVACNESECLTDTVPVYT